ncbi:MAG TPA: alpha/beta hydrolase-fold protein [Vicinamibacterales bacterium]|nr:alpha/beta hydrolase-fold protein [Vicinamibacterales bacterium]HOG30156.1 alpha/beta hydrolase-fold protein [Vicinamibacterales bacterium]HOQ59012.1 alpha/beta hydrolase-fold protein [Vicinamibacterales bacterium]HPK70955.1 alpha/beta hydrolase-fold protein [Vicinamibacterales bacterium]HPW19560.1 alpha/beta hydrolase-fold protein [Vicinamibacterales bacterium]
MRTEYHRWYSGRVGREMGLVVYGHWGPPMLVFPTSGGDEWEMERQGMVAALADFIDPGRVKVFTIDANSRDSFYNRGAHPFHRSYMQAQYDAYVREEVVPFIRRSCQSDDIAITTAGASLGAYHAANTLFKHPDAVRRCYALSGVYDLKRFMDGMYDDNFYFNNPVDYMSNLDDPRLREWLGGCDIHLATGHGPWEDKGPTYRMAEVLRTKGIPHSLDDWGGMGGHDWPFWKHQMRTYLSAW